MFTIRKKDTCLENMDSFDARSYDDILLQSKAFQDMQKDNGQILPTFPSLQRDIWGSLYKYNPQIKAVMDNRDLIINHEILKKLTSNSSFQGAREYTRMDELASAINTLSMAEKISELIKNTLDDRTKQTQQELHEMQKKLEQSEFKREALQQKLDTMQQKLDASPEAMQDVSPEQQQKLLQQVQQLQQKLKQERSNATKTGNQAQKLQEELQGEVQKLFNAPSFDQALDQAVSSSSEEARGLTQEVNILSGGGWGSGSVGNSGYLLDKLQLAQAIKNDPQLKKVLKLAGNMKSIAIRKRKLKSENTTLKQDVETGNNIERLLPSELLLYSNPATKQVFLKKFSEGECLQYSTRAKEKLGEGPMVCCVDVSGSMKKPVCGGDATKRAEWAKAVAYALWSVAQRQHRRFYLIEFDDVIIDNYEVEKPQLSRLLEVKHLGWTNFFAPLYMAFSIIRKNGNFKKADVVMITDGDARLGEVQLKTINEWKRAYKTHIYSIQLGTRRDTLEPFSDKVICYDGSCSFTEVFERV